MNDRFPGVARETRLLPAIFCHASGVKPACFTKYFSLTEYSVRTNLPTGTLFPAWNRLRETHRLRTHAGD